VGQLLQLSSTLTENDRDTRVLLSSADGGIVFPMTENHHADTRVESIRLRRMGSALVTDSFGDSR